MKTLTKKLKSHPKPLIIPYIMAGDGGLDNLAERIQLLEEAGAAAIEIGIPFSDPVADGPVIQLAGLRAFEAGVTLEKVLNELAELQTEIPLIVMTYFNPVFHFGTQRFVEQLKKTPVKGVIIPDLPAEESHFLTPYLQETDLALIPLVSLTSPKERVQKLVEQAEGLVYAVTVNGTTGERPAFDPHLQEHFDFIRRISEVPVLAGFGVSTLDHVRFFSRFSDGVIIGSKVVQAFHEKREEELISFIQQAAESES
ncbi:tryptophan synthase subunit alpha [Listeria costaricensis]|uniref:tryptophan synthase subunit alpha n=1 Tax=Listeria costaricensis TaxID=2026604 RepID=UPI000C07D422|nr:tryptophan synthase subunit alpha [Listeria costaricensis]